MWSGKEVTVIFNIQFLLTTALQTASFTGHSHMTVMNCFDRRSNVSAFLPEPLLVCEKSQN